MKRRQLWYQLAMVQLTILYALGQEASPGGVPVHMVVSVEARHGTTPPEITREDVMVREGRDRDRVTDWEPAQGDHAGLEFFILIDDGASISLGSQLDDLRQFITAQPATTKIGIAYMQNGIAQVLQNPTSDHGQAAKALRLPLGVIGADASPYFSLQDLIKRWPESTDRREVFMVSDGVDWFGGTSPDDPYVDAAIADAQRAGVIVFDIYMPGRGHAAHSYWQYYWGQLYLSKVADETGGEAYYIGFSGAPVAFTPYLDSMAQRLSHQYFLGFFAKPEKKAGLRRVRLQTEVPNAELVAPSQVYVPASAQ
ncbi:MAG TPA: hypothetical protein VEK33_17495 [Terriglobales bacterium]|nr:hypothetical protein [Terriglobales bacterium]